jgi:hypothetical protein
VVTHVDLAAAMCKALDLPDHSAVQPHLDWAIQAYMQDVAAIPNLT